MKVKKLMSILEKFNPEAEIKMHGIEGNHLLFAVSYEKFPNIIVMEDKEDCDLSVELEARFEYAAEEQVDELDFFTDLMDTGFTLEDFQNNIPDRYEYVKEYLKDHGLV